MTTLSSGEQYELLAQEAELLAQKSPDRYKRKLVWFALLGYGIILLTLLLLLGLTAGLAILAFWHTTLFVLLIKKKIIFLTIPAIWIILKSLWIKIEAPQGTKLIRKDFPKLFEDLDTLRAKMNAPPIHQVILTPEMNAGIVQTPRLGIFGFHKNTLILGMELLHVLSRHQMQSVIAHELGHLSGNHSRFNNWIYRLRNSWWQIMESFAEQGGFAGALMGRFFSWYAPRFSALSFALARENEYEADGYAAQICTAQVAASALVSTYAIAPLVDKEYWREFFAQADHKERPDTGPWTGFMAFVERGSIAQQSLKDSLVVSLKYKTNFSDTHPCLKDRLKALGLSQVAPLIAKRSAANDWLGGQWRQISEEWDRLWFEANLEAWQSRYQQAVEAREKIASLESENVEFLNIEQLTELAVLQEEFGDKQKALALYQRWFDRDNKNAEAALAMGRILFSMDDEKCMDYFNIAMGSPLYAGEAFDFVHDWLTRQGRYQELEHFKKIAMRQYDNYQIANAERMEVSVNDTFETAQPGPKLKEQLHHLLSNHPKVKKAWIAQKTVSQIKEAPVYVVSFSLKGLVTNEMAISEKLAEQLNIDDSSVVFFVPRSGEFKALAKKVEKAGLELL